MPVAVIGPAGASIADMRQLSGARARNLSWLKLASTCSAVPNTPECNRRMASMMGGSKRRSCPTARVTPQWLTAATARNTSSRDMHRGFSQNTCLPARAHASIWSACWVWGVHKITPWTAGSARTFSRLLSKAMPCDAAKACPDSASTSTALTSLSLALPLSWGRIVRPHQPRPIRATFSMMRTPWASRAVLKKDRT